MRWSKSNEKEVFRFLSQGSFERFDIAVIGSKNDLPKVSINLLFHTGTISVWLDQPGYLFIKYLFALEAKEFDEDANWQGWKFILEDPAGAVAPRRFPKINVYTSNETLSTRVNMCV